MAVWGERMQVRQTWCACVVHIAGRLVTWWPGADCLQGQGCIAINCVKALTWYRPQVVRQQPVPRSDFVQQLDLEAEEEEEAMPGLYL